MQKNRACVGQVWYLCKNACDGVYYSNTLERNTSSAVSDGMKRPPPHNTLESTRMNNMDITQYTNLDLRSLSEVRQLRIRQAPVAIQEYDDVPRVH